VKPYSSVGSIEATYPKIKKIPWAREAIHCKTMSSSTTPASILIVGGGVFGLSTALALAQRPLYANTKITLVDPHSCIPDCSVATTASVDSTRIVRVDYSDPYYSKLADEAQAHWRQIGDDQLGGQGRYSENGLLLTAELKGAEQYVLKALKNVRKLEGVGEEGIPEIRGAEGIARAMRAPGAALGSGELGYINNRSGWADSERSMRWLWEKVEALGCVEFVTGQASKVIADGDRVRGVILKDGQELRAEQTILAAGAWTGALVDLRGVASPRAQCIGYVTLTEEEDKALRGIPVHLNLSTGLFYFPSSRGEIKVARHAFGYSNPTEIPAPLGSNPNEKTIITTLPTFPVNIPTEDERVQVDFLNSTLPCLQHRVAKLDRSRLCWYLDTASSDFLVCQYPGFGDSLYLATGGSGHGFKFLPVLGERIVDVLDGTDISKNEGIWTKKWTWPGRGTVQPTPSGRTDAYVDMDGEIWCLDFSRAGEMGQNLVDALAGKQTASKQIPQIVKDKGGAETSGKSRL